ncbi:MAG: amino acid permease [Candidatus Aminicenantes bacterium]|nr:amino acid permease [Candidatus Aminicenantes bacterium]
MEKKFTGAGEAQDRLPRVLNLTDIISIVVGGVIGSGIFLVPAKIALEVKSPLLMLLVWVVGGFLSFLGALTFAELGAAMPEAGGMYVYLREAYGPLLSFLFGWTLFLVIDSGAIATLAVAFSANYLPYFFKLTPLMSKIIAVLFILFLAAVNYVGVRWGANLQNLLTLIKVGAIAGICGVIFIFGHGQVKNFFEPQPGKFSFDLVSTFGVAMVATFWAYKGWESATYSAGEVKKPGRNMPLGLLFGLSIVIGLYLLANLAYLYVLPAPVVAATPRVAAEAMKVAVGPLGASIISFVILFSIMGAANQNLICSPRVYFAMSRDGLFFKNIARVHPRFLTPHISIIFISIWSIILSLSGTFEQLFTYVVFGQWLFFGLTGAAVFVLRKKRPDLPRPYRTWGYPFTPAIFVLAAFLISVNSLVKEFWNSLAGLGIILLGLPAYFYWKGKQGRASLSK